ncbi:MAG: SOS response-associated peptidase [Bacteroidota bacterium]
MKAIAMCGRYTFTKVPKSESVINPDGVVLDLKPRYNQAPGQYALIRTQEAPTALSWHRWGLIPAWAKDKKIAYKLINARAETVAEKPSFRTAFQRYRCLVLADGFFEWKKTLSGKIPHWITLADESAFAFAGLSESWTSPEGKPLHTFTVITTEPNELMVDIHDRMPAILTEETARLWLQPDLVEKDAQALLQPFPAGLMKAHPVSPEVGKVQHDHPGLIQPYEPPPTLF